MSGLPPSHPGNGPAIENPAIDRQTTNATTLASPCLITFLAWTKSLEPMRWATCTENPCAAAIANPPKIQVVVETRPMEAEGLAPRLPTIDASMNCSSTDATCAIMAGPQRYIVSRTCCPSASGSPSRILPKSISLLAAIFQPRKSMKKPRMPKHPEFSFINLLPNSQFI